MKIALIGYGKMGKMIEEIAQKRGHEISFRIDIDNQSDLDKLSPANTDVAIEFTTPHTAYDNVMQCLKHGVNVVCGSTGWNEKLPDAKQYAITNNIGLLWASNFSIGVNIFFKVNQYLAKLMNNTTGYEPEMTEIHHIHKKDAPSGTAITLAEGLIENYSAKKSWKLSPEKEKDAIIITSERTGEVPGTHIIKYNSEADYIEITHCAKNRRGLALGAVVAAEFLKGKKGIYNMCDVLNL
jgi:4-hydroxy-tetrahydrodipicolinate reductase